jgi:hypothetical protein
MNTKAASASTTGQPLAIRIEDRLRDLIPRVLGTILRKHRDFPGAEDAVQEAALAAAMQWPRDGMPENPHAWLTQVAFRSMADQVRSDSARRHRETDFALRAVHQSESTDDALEGSCASRPFADRTFFAAPIGAIQKTRSHSGPISLPKSPGKTGLQPSRMASARRVPRPPEE